MQEEGYVAAILFDAGSKDIPLGTVVAVLAENEEDVPKFADYKADGPAAPTPAAAAPEPAASATPASTPAAAAPSAPAGGMAPKSTGDR